MVMPITFRSGEDLNTDAHNVFVALPTVTRDDMRYYMVTASMGVTFFRFECGNE